MVRIKRQYRQQCRFFFKKRSTRDLQSLEQTRLLSAPLALTCSSPLFFFPHMYTQNAHSLFHDQRQEHTTCKITVQSSTQLPRMFEHHMALWNREIDKRLTQMSLTICKLLPTVGLNTEDTTEDVFIFFLCFILSSCCSSGDVWSPGF